jgi:hypothetical protein
MDQAVFEKHAHVVGVARKELSRHFVKRHKAGESIRSLAASSGRSYGFTHRLLVEAGVRFRRQGGGNNRSRSDAAHRKP